MISLCESDNPLGGTLRSAKATRTVECPASPDTRQSFNAGRREMRRFQVPVISSAPLPQHVNRADTRRLDSDSVLLEYFRLLTCYLHEEFLPGHPDGRLGDFSHDYGRDACSRPASTWYVGQVKQHVLCGGDSDSQFGRQRVTDPPRRSLTCKAHRFGFVAQYLCPSL